MFHESFLKDSKVWAEKLQPVEFRVGSYLCCCAVVLLLDVRRLTNAVFAEEVIHLVVAPQLHLLELVLGPCIHAHRPVHGCVS